MKPSKETATFLESLVGSRINLSHKITPSNFNIFLETLGRHGHPVKMLHGVVNTYVDILPKKEKE